VSDLLGRAPWEGELERALMGAFGLDHAAECTTWGAPTSLEGKLEERYRSESWTWRR